MIKSISLTFNSMEMEHAYRKWMFERSTLKYKILLCFISIYLIVMIIKFNGQNDGLLPLIISCISLCAQLTILFFISKYGGMSEMMITLNQILLAAISEIFRVFGGSLNQWYFGSTICCLKLGIDGNRFLMQSLIQTICQSGSYVYMEDEESYQIIAHSLITIIFILLRYQIESGTRKYFIASQSQEQYENMLQDLLPSWVIIIKYDKMQAQLQIDKINKNMKNKMNINDDKAFRDFLRKLKVLPYDTERQSLQYIKLEQVLIRQLQQQSEDHEVERYHAILDKNENKNKQWRFKITQVYFKTFEPQIILLFEELKEDKYEQLLIQIDQKDKTSFTNSKISLNLLTQQIQLLKYIKLQMPTWFHGRSNQYPVQVHAALINQIQQCYQLFNQSFNTLNLFKVSHRQMKFEINEIATKDLLQQICEDLQLHKKLMNKDLLNLEFDDIIKTDKAKLLSIIINLVEFLKITLSIMHNEDKIMNQITPLGSQIVISIKKSKIQKQCIKISLTHPKFNMPEYIIDLFGYVYSTIDHKKRNWGAKNYFDMMNQLNHTYQQMYEYFKKDNKSTSLMEDDLLPFNHLQKGNVNHSQESRLNTNHNLNLLTSPQYSFNTIGYPIAQYLISQLGPSNKIQFKKTHSHYLGTPTQTYIRSSQQTKMEFLLYSDLSEFIKELNSIDHPIIEIMQKKKQSYDLSQKIFLSQLVTSPRK